MDKIWKVLDENPSDLKKSLLRSRKVKDPDSFFKPHLYKLTSPNKYFSDLGKAVERIMKAIKERELIYIYGDFDVDGITGTAILWETIDFLGGKVLPFIPHRDKDGYGLHSEAIGKLKKEGAKVIISVDCGITAVDEAKTAKKLGVDLIITDHHTIPSQTPNPFALLHTENLAGSGVAFMLAKELLDYFKGREDGQLFRNLELAAIGTVADMVPLTGDNRIIVANGIHNLSNSDRVGLRALYDEAGLNKKVGIFEIGFLISPRLNASGRMENAMDSLRLLLTKKEERAALLSKKLGKTNRERQVATREGLKHARNRLKDDSKAKMLVVHHDSYLSGVIGLVAGRLADEFYKPTIVISESEPISKGSARSISGFNITEAIGKQKTYLKSHGGHPMAAGFSLEKKNIPKFKDKIINYAEKNLNKKDLTRVLNIDAYLDTSYLSTQLLEYLKEFEPFGIGNPEPVFLSKDLEVVNIKKVGSNGKHLRMVLRDPRHNIFNCIGFGLGEKNLDKGNKIDVAYNLKEDDWNGTGRLEFKVKDFRIVA